MITVHTFGTTHVAVGISHLGRPWIAFCIYPLTLTSGRVLDTNIEVANLHMAHLVVAGLPLCFSWVSVRFCFGSFNFSLYAWLFNNSFFLRWLIINIIYNLLYSSKRFSVILIRGAGIITFCIGCINLIYDIGRFSILA